MTAPSYDDFKNLVAAAHQKPVDQKDMQVLQGAAVQQFPPIRNKAATTVRTSGARSGLGRRRRAPGQTATATAQPTKETNIVSLRTFQSEWGKCVDAQGRQGLLRQIAPAQWQQWASKNSDAVDGACVAGIMQEAAELAQDVCTAWCVACVGCFQGPALAVWGGTLPPLQAALARASLQQAAQAAQGGDKTLLDDAIVALNWGDASS